MDYKFKTKEHYEQNKKKFNKKYNMIWRKLSPSPFVGNCSYLIHRYNPKSYEEFWNMYINDFSNESYMWDTCKGDPHRGRSIEQINNLATLYHQACNDPNITLEDCFDDVVNHVIIETFDGHIVERALREKLNESGDLMIEEMEDEWDSKYGIDLKIISKKDANYFRYIQVKPISFFIGNSNASLIEDRKKRFDSENSFKIMLENYGKENQYNPILYMAYDKRLLDTQGIIKFMWIGKKNKFTLNELINENGFTKVNFNEIIFKGIQ